MTPTETAAILRQFNNWCRDPSDFPASPMLIEKAIESAIEIIDRLEAAEAEALEEARLNGMGSEREASLLVKLEAAEKERDFAKAEIARLHDDIHELTDERDTYKAAYNEWIAKTEWVQDELTRNKLPVKYLSKLPVKYLGMHRADVIKTEIDSLRAKVEAMERQEPIAKVRINSITGNPSVDFIPGHRYLHHNSSLYALPGAQPTPSVPDGWNLVPTAESRHPGIYKMLGALHAIDNTRGASEWESYAAMLAAAPKPKS